MRMFLGGVGGFGVGVGVVLRVILRIFGVRFEGFSGFRSIGNLCLCGWSRRSLDSS